MSTPIHTRLHMLPETSITTLSLHALDFIVPGEWNNIVNFRQLIEVTTGEEDREVQNRIARRALALYDSEDENYQTAMRVFELVDSVDKLVSAAATANKVGENFDFLGILERYTPKADTTQAIDAALKLIAEAVVFFLLTGFEYGDISAFAGSLGHYGKSDKMRLAALVVFEGVVPLGPDFLQKVVHFLDEISSDELGENKLYRAIADYIPGETIPEQQNFIQSTLVAMQGWITGFIEEHGITQDLVVDKVSHALQVADNSLDFVAAALDGLTNYYEHTGTQTVARVVIERAYSELQEEEALYGYEDEETLTDAQIDRVYDAQDAIAAAIAAAQGGQVEEEEEYEYVYVDEDGNEVAHGEDDEEYEYVYVDEDGNEVDP